jgi:hypothetical protein
MARLSKLTQELANEACNALISTQSKATIANIRRWLMENYGFAGNNNDLCPLVQTWKSEVRHSSRVSDPDAFLQIAIASSQIEDIPIDIKLEADRLIGILYQSVLDKVDSQVGSDRVVEMQLEIDNLQLQLHDYHRMKAEYDAMTRAYEPLARELASTNRLLDMQKVAQGELMVDEIRQTQDKYDALASETAEIRTQLEYSRQRNNEVGNFLNEKTEENTHLTQRVNDLENALTLLNHEKPDNLPQLQMLTDRNNELIQQVEKLENKLRINEDRNLKLKCELDLSISTSSQCKFAISLLKSYLSETGRDFVEIDKSRKAGDKELCTFTSWLNSRRKQLDIKFQPSVSSWEDKVDQVLQ